MAQETSKLTTELLNERNYLSWARLVTFTLSGRGKLGHVTSTKKMPVAAKPIEPTDEEVKKIEEWQMSDHLVMSWILASIEPQLAKMFLYANSASELWEKIKAMYGQQNNFAYIYQLKQEIHQAKKGNRNHSEYLVYLTAKFDELEVYLPPTTDPDEIARRREQDKVYIYLGELDSSFEAVRSQILLSAELPTFSAVVASVQREDARRAAMNTEVTEPLQSQENQAYTVSLTQSKESQAHTATAVNPNCEGRRFKRGKESDRCSHYKKEGHTQDKCWFLHPHLWPKRRNGEGDWKKRDSEKRGFVSAREGETDLQSREGGGGSDRSSLESD